MQRLVCASVHLQQAQHVCKSVQSVQQCTVCITCLCKSVQEYKKVDKSIQSVQYASSEVSQASSCAAALQWLFPLFLCTPATHFPHSQFNLSQNQSTGKSKTIYKRIQTTDQNCPLCHFLKDQADKQYLIPILGDFFILRKLKKILLSSGDKCSKSFFLFNAVLELKMSVQCNQFSTFIKS